MNVETGVDQNQCLQRSLLGVEILEHKNTENGSKMRRKRNQTELETVQYFKNPPEEIGVEQR